MVLPFSSFCILLFSVVKWRKCELWELTELLLLVLAVQLQTSSLISLRLSPPLRTG